LTSINISHFQLKKKKKNNVALFHTMAADSIPLLVQPDLRISHEIQGISQPSLCPKCHAPFSELQWPVVLGGCGHSVCWSCFSGRPAASEGLCCGICRLFTADAEVQPNWLYISERNWTVDSSHLRAPASGLRDERALVKQLTDRQTGRARMTEDAVRLMVRFLCERILAQPFSHDDSVTEIYFTDADLDQYCMKAAPHYTIDARRRWVLNAVGFGAIAEKRIHQLGLPGHTICAPIRTGEETYRCTIRSICGNVPMIDPPVEAFRNVLH
jgi:hypothetical protein